MKTRMLILAGLLILSYSQAEGQKAGNKKIFITGFVTDINNNPVKDAMILIDKKNSSVLTDEKGFYRVRIKPDSKKISVFTIKSGTGESEINGSTSVNIRLNGTFAAQAPNPDNEKIDIGYGQTSRKEVTSQVNKVKNNDEKYASYSNIYDMLRGTVPGVQIIGKEIKIQGSDFHSGNPLLVVDGNIVSSIDDIHPVQVRSVEVLKGASASIYGSRGAQGVLLIHLKGTSER